MIQTGGMDKDLQEKTTHEPIKNEANNGLKNVRGTIAMARTFEPHSASSQFFINLVDNEFLNFKSEDMSGWGYTVFGKVVTGMDVVDAIAKLPTTVRNGMQDVPKELPIIKRASRTVETESKP
jgi:cyclophilin family peptidyl-prolyl cis-trans isomerase